MLSSKPQDNIELVANKDESSQEKNANEIHKLICRSDAMTDISNVDIDWKALCDVDFAKKTAQLLFAGNHAHVVQIGAHVGFEHNDPLANGLINFIDEVASLYDNDGADLLRTRLHWTFVEPSPPNFERLQENLKNHSSICDMKGVNAAIVSDSIKETGKMLFYSVRDTIDPETGFDTLSGKTLPRWITQVSSFSKAPILFNRNVFKRNGLNVNDYIVETNVDTKSFSVLMNETMPASGKLTHPQLVLIDTEGLDCNIIKGISPSSAFLPEYIIYEHKQCNYTGAEAHLRNLGYYVKRLKSENTVAVKI